MSPARGAGTRGARHTRPRSGRFAARRIGCGLAAAALASAASILLLLLLLEGALRLIAPQPLLHDPDAFVPDPNLGARLKPGFADQVTTTEFSSRWEINQEGYRGPAAGTRGLAGVRIAALGDSFTFGYGVQEAEAWPRRLEVMLNGGASGVERAEVLNLGVGGYGTWQEAAWLDDGWERTHPDTVILAFYPGNDLADNLREEARRAAAGGDASTGTAGAPRRLERFKRGMAGRSHLYSFVSSRGGELLVKLGLRQLVYPAEVEVLLVHPPEEVERGWEATRRALTRFKDLSRQRGFRLLVVYVPMKHEVDDAIWQRVRDYYGQLTGAPSPESLFDRGAARRSLGTICETLGVPWIDLSDPLRAAAPDAAQLYWERDQHFNARGHDAAAAAIARWLSEASRVPDRQDHGEAAVDAQPGRVVR